MLIAPSIVACAVHCYEQLRMLDTDWVAQLAFQNASRQLGCAMLNSPRLVRRLSHLDFAWRRRVWGWKVPAKLAHSDNAAVCAVKVVVRAAHCNAVCAAMTANGLVGGGNEEGLVVWF